MVQRFNSTPGGMDESERGEFVEHAEYATLRTDLAEAVGLLRECADWIDADVDPPQRNGRDVVKDIRTFLTRHPATSERSEG